MVPTPYPGLRPFQPHEAEVFFGRERHTDRLLEILQRERFLAVIGPSGCGKSSLVRAGMLPALAAGWLGTGSDWRTAIVRPGDRPFRRLAESLLTPLVFGPELLEPVPSVEPRVAAAVVPPPIIIDTPDLARRRIEAELLRGSLGLVHLTADVRALAERSDFNLLVLVDQFEELFTYATAHDAGGDTSEAFVDLLLHSRADPAARIYVAITMRTDFLGHCVRFLDLPEAINRGQYLIPRLTRPELSSAICDPAGLFGGTVDPALAEELVNEVSGKQDELPLLQHLLNRMWDLARPADQDAAAEIGRSHYEQVGGVDHALSRHADAMFDSLSANDRVVAERIFRSITERRMGSGGGQEVRRPQTLAQIAAATEIDWPAIASVVEQFAREGIHFLSPIASAHAAESVVDISHEALIRQWARLKTWVKEEAERAADYRRWCSRASDYASGGELLVRADLARAIEWREGVTPTRSSSSAWRPTAAWARRYASEPGEAAEAAEAEFLTVLQFIAASEQAEQRRVEAELEAARQQRTLDDERLTALARAARAEAQVERERADAAALQRTEAEKHATQYLEQKLEAERLWRLAEERAAEARARQTATEALQYFTDDPDRAQLLAVLAYEIAPLPATELVLRQAFVRGQGLKGVLRGHAGAVRGGRFSTDGRRVVTIGGDSTARIWDVQRAAPVSTVTGHSAAILSATLSRDGSRVVTASADGTARVCDAATGELGSSLEHGANPVVDAVFAADGETILTATPDMTLRRWKATTGALLETLTSDDARHRAAVLSGAFSGGGRILTASADGTARLWNADTGELMFVLQGHEKSVNHAAFSPDGTIAATCSDDCTARLWDVATGRERATLRGHGGYVHRIAFRPDGRYLLTGSFDGTARVWDVAAGTESIVLRGHSDAVYDVAYSRDGTLAATASADETVRVWRVESGLQVSVFEGHTTAVSQVAFSPDSRQVLSVGWDGELMLWDTAQAYVLLSDPGLPDRLDGLPSRAGVSYAAFSPDGATVIAGGSDGTLRHWDVATGEVRVEVSLHSKRISRITCAPDGDLLLATSYDGTASLSRLSSPGLIRRLEGHDDAILDGAFSADGTRVLTVGLDNAARLWRTDNDRDSVVLGLPGDTSRSASRSDPVGTFATDAGSIVWVDDDGPGRWSVITGSGLATIALGETDSASRAEFSRDGTVILTVSHDGLVRLWRSDGLVLGSIEESGTAVVRASFSADGSLVVTANADGTLRVWEAAPQPHLASDATTSEVWAAGCASRARLYGHTGDITTAAISPDNRTVVCGGADGALRLWDAGTGQILGVLAGHGDAVLHAEFGPDGDDLLTTSKDGTARLWRTTTGTPLYTRHHQGGKLFSAWVSPDGEQVLTAGHEATPHLWNAATPSQATALIGHDKPILATAFNIRLGMVMTVAADGTARLWDSTSGQTLRALGTGPEEDRGGVTAVAFVPDGRAVVTAGEDGRARIWTNPEGELLHAWTCHEDPILTLACDRRGGTIATTSADCTTRLWNPDGSLRATLREHSAPVEALTFSTDGTMIATGGGDMTVRLWKTDTGDLLRLFRGHPARVMAIAFSRDGSRLLTAGVDGTARIWDVANGSAVATLGHGDRLTAAALAPDGRHVATASRDGMVRLWDARGQVVHVLTGHRGPVTSVQFSPDGTRLVSASQDSSVRLWECTTGGLLAAMEGHQASAVKVLFSASGRRILSVSSDRTVRVWDSGSGQTLVILSGHTDAIVDVAMSADDTTVLTASRDNTTRLWDAITGESLRTLGRIEGSDIERALFAGGLSADGSRVLTADANSVHVWDVRTAHRVRAVLAERRIGRRLVLAAFRGDGTAAITVSNDGMTRMWNVDTGASMAELSAVDPTTGRPEKTVTCVAISADDRVIATGCADGSGQLWNGWTGERLCGLHGHEAQMFCIAFSPDGARVATAGADRMARLWDSRTGRALATLRGHGNAVSLVAFSPDGRTIATAGDDHNVIVWEVASGKVLMTLRGHSAPLASLAFRANGRELVTAGHDGTVRTWDCRVSAPPDELSALIKERIGRVLSSEERVQSGLLETDSPT